MLVLTGDRLPLECAFCKEAIPNTVGSVVWYGLRPYHFGLGPCHRLGRLKEQVDLGEFADDLHAGD
jgi:hypothetical protein